MIAYLVSLLVVGFIVGALARLLLPGPDPMGCLSTAVLGVAGSFVGGVLADVFVGRQSVTSLELHSTGVIGSIIGAMVLLLLLRLVRR